MGADEFLSVIVISHNTSELLADCLRSLMATCRPGDEVVVVDNASVDDTLGMLRARFPTVTIVANRSNVGFGTACNQGVQRATRDVVLLLNSDAVVRPDVLRRLVLHLASHPEAALVGPRLLNGDGSVQPSAFRFPTPLVLLQHELGLGWSLEVPCAGRNWIEADWLSGACIAGRRAELAAIGPFDGNFFMYGEDIDLGYRLRKAGRHLHLLPGVELVHLGGRSASRRWLQMSLQATASMYRFYRKHYSRQLVFAVAIFRCAAVLKLMRDISESMVRSGKGGRPGAAPLWDRMRFYIGVLRLSPFVGVVEAPAEVEPRTRTIR